MTDKQAGSLIVEISPRGLSAAAFDSALKLARAFEVELEGLFVEDADLLALAGLPFSSEIQTVTGQVRVLESRQLEADLRRAAGAARREFERRALATAHSCRFRVVREAATRVIAREGQAAALIFLSELTARTHWQAELSRLAVGEGVPTDIVLFGPAARSRPGPVLILLDAEARVSELTQRAGKVARIENTEVGIIVLEPASEKLKRLAEEVRAGLHPGSEVWIAHEGDGDPDQIGHWTARKKASLLIADSASSWTRQTDHLSRLLLRAECPVLIAGAR